MAIVANKANSKFKLVLNAGLDEKNRDIIKNKTFSNVKSASTNDSIFAVATSLAELQEYTLTNVVKYEEYDLVDEG